MYNFAQLQSYQVLQRDADDKARVELAEGEIVELSVGGPYTLGNLHDLLVGDIWVLAGQSNMEGVGNLIDVEPPSPFVHSFQSREQWAIAEEPLHWLLESPHDVHYHIMGLQRGSANLPPRDGKRATGSGLGLTFAKERYARTAVPVGLIPAAHGGTSMEQWDPQKHDQGGDSLYGALLLRVARIGGKIAGVLWYQGESDTFERAYERYEPGMTALVNALRADSGQPDLPFYYVQIGRVVADRAGSELWPLEGWNRIRELQRHWQGALPRTALVSAIDLELEDLIHIGTQGLKRLGRRLADAADGLYAPTFSGLSREHAGLRLRLSYHHVRGGLYASGRPSGFSLRDSAGKEIPIIHKITLEEHTVVLHLTSPDLPTDTALWYGWGLDPYCNITDATDAAIPAFGPLVLSTLLT